MALRKYVPSSDGPSMNIKSLSFSTKVNEKVQLDNQETSSQDDVDIDIREVYFLIMHFLSAGPCHRTYGQFWNELLEHQLLPRRYHAWYSRSGEPCGDENDDGLSFPLSYNKLVERYPHIEKDHLVKLLKQLIQSTGVSSQGVVGGNVLNAASVPTLLGTGSFSLLDHHQDNRKNEVKGPPDYMRWPHMKADPVRGLGLREIGGGFARHHRAPSVRAACYSIAKPSTMVQKMQNIKKLRGHRNAVYCSIFDRNGRYVITGSDDRLVKIWSMETAYCLASCRGHEGDITDLAVNYNNYIVASASNDFIIRVWRLPDGLPISVLRGHTGAVTAIAFSPRPNSAYQLLSSSDDGTCRIWDARYSHSSPRLYVPKPPESVAGKNNGPSTSISQQSHQIFCCAFSASGTVFVTGSSDTFARVWNACKSNTEDSEQPNHEMDVLAGHENDVNYVQFSGCAVASRFSTSDTSKEDHIPKFKSSWFNHDNIVTCSRDGSAIIWIPRSRRSHGKGGRWTRAYHLKVPPPPMPPQPPRGGPRQRILPTPRGVNMIVWSLDNRFVLAAIMDCRICVWNAVDGSLVHSLTGHSESTYVLDVHPFNPRIAMSAGYDGKTIVWDIWEGTPIRIYEIGRFKLVDGKFSPDGTSIILSDEVGQLYILSTGQGESQNDAKYDQFFLGDYRPLTQDTHGNVLDQETQLVPYRRNMQDLLCDSGMIPYPEPYQSMYQRRRLGALGIEWRPSSLRFAIGTDITLDQDYQMPPIADLDILIDPLPEFIDAMDWEPENEVQSEDNDSEYHVTEEYSSGGEQGKFISISSGDAESSTEDSEVDGLRRSKRKKPKAEVEIMTSSGRRVKRKNVGECDKSSSRSYRTKKSRNGRKVSRRKSLLSQSIRPQRAAALNALHLFSRITGTSADGEDEEGFEGDSSESESTQQDSNAESEESDVSLQDDERDHLKGKELFLEESEDVAKPNHYTDSNVNAGNRRRLVLKLPIRDSSKLVPLQNSILNCDSQHDISGILPEAPQEVDRVNTSGFQDLGCTSGDAQGDKIEISDMGPPPKVEHHLDLLERYKDGPVRWGGVKIRTSKRMRMGEPLSSDAYPEYGSSLDGRVESENFVNEHVMPEKEYITISNSSGTQDVAAETGKMVMDQNYYKDCSPEDLAGPRNGGGHVALDECKVSDESPNSSAKINEEASFSVSRNNANSPELKEKPTPVPMKLKIRSRVLSKDNESHNPIKIKFKSSVEKSRDGACDNTLSNRPSDKEQNDDIEQPSLVHKGRDGLLDFDSRIDNSSRSVSHGSQELLTQNRMYSAVYTRLKSSQARCSPEGKNRNMEASTSNAGTCLLDEQQESANGVRTRSKGRRRSTAHRLRGVSSTVKLRKAYDGSEETSTSNEKSSRCDELSTEEWGSSSRAAVGIRSTRNRRSSSYYAQEISPLEARKSHQSARSSWLMMSMHEEGSRYIPQQGDDVVYLIQGHQEYTTHSGSRDAAPWKTMKGDIRAVEFCRVEDLEYATRPGSGESCCKMTLQFIDPASSVFGKSFKLTLPEVTGFPDFLVERSRYDAAVERNWASRDKFQVWWKNEGDEDGSWWEGRILTVKSKSPEFPDSPWERYIVQYKSDPTETHRHSAWELYDADTQWEQPHIDDKIRDKLLHSLAKLDRSGDKIQDPYGVQKLKQACPKSNFVNRFPVPITLELIQSRLENNYYRSLEAMEHDVSVMLKNAELYFGKNVETSTKLRRLSEWFERTFAPL